MSKRIGIQVIEFDQTGLLIAFSDDLPGLYVYGRSDDDLEKNLPVAIKDLLEAQGKRNVKVVKVDGRSVGVSSSGLQYQADAA